MENTDHVIPYAFHGSKPSLARSNSNQINDCALVLKRSFNLKNYNRDDSNLSFKQQIKSSKNLNTLDNQAEVCVRYRDVNLAIKQAKMHRRYVKPKNLKSIEPPLASIDITGELFLQVTKILAVEFQLSPDEILNGLPLIDMSQTNAWEDCPDYVKPVPCTVERYRSYTGHCNNLKHNTWGATYTPFVRYLPPMYADGIQAPRVSIVDGSELPSPRLVTSTVHKDYNDPDSKLSIMLMSWGQFIDHDFTLAASPRDENDHDFDCCASPYANHPNCMPIKIPENDPFFSQFNKKCMDFKRSLAGHRPNCALGPRIQINTLTSAIDANFLYGSTEELSKRLRAFQGGLMRVWDRFSQYGLKPLLPPESENPEKDCHGRPRNLFCFIAGDERVNEQIHLTVLHTLYVRDHNRMATELGKLNPHWDDEKIYQETRHIIAAAVQHITINEFLPLLLGEETVKRYNLTIQSDGYANSYDPTVHMGPAHAFQSSAFRFGHTFIQGSIRRYNKYHQFLGEDLLRNLLRHPFMVYEPGKIDELIGGLINTPSQKYDPFITKEISNHLFQKPNIPFGLDLPALNLARGREQGVPGYNFYREWCGLKRAKTFEELTPYLQNSTVYHYSRLYKHPDDIDLWSGGISEVKMPGSIIGPTFACIIARQFSNIRKGDRFWYDNEGFPSSFTLDQLNEIKKATQAKIVCENADDMPTIQMWVMKQYDPVKNPRFNCQDLPSIDLRFWKENPNTGKWMYKKRR